MLMQKTGSQALGRGILSEANDVVVTTTMTSNQECLRVSGKQIQLRLTASFLGLLLSGIALAKTPATLPSGQLSPMSRAATLNYPALPPEIMEKINGVKSTRPAAPAK